MEEVKRELPLTAQGVEEFLESKYAPGIGKSYARKIVSVYGTEALSVILGNPEEAASASGVPEASIQKASEAIREMKHSPEFVAFLFSAGVSDLFVERILGKYRGKAEERVAEDPYSMVEDVWQLSFFTAEKIGRLLGTSAEDPARIEAALITAVKRYSDAGHLFAPLDKAIENAAELAGVDEALIRPALEAAIARRRLVISMEGIYIPVFYEAEIGVARRLARLSESSISPVEISSLPDRSRFGQLYSPRQKEAMAKVLSSPVSVITGGPGTGKTTILSGIIERLEEEGKKIALVAPTGRAAKRMQVMTGHDASTIHRLLGWGASDRKPRLKLDYDVVVIDEGSMMEQVLFNHLLESLREDARIIMVGDVDQLPAIGAGDVMRGLIESRRIPVAELDENFRQEQGSLIAAGAQTINRGGMPLADATRDFMIVSERGTSRIRDRILRLVAEELPGQRGVDPFEIQVVTPQQIGPLGARQLNVDLQARLNPEGPQLVRGGTIFRLGDPVMQTSNSRERGLYNGETGRICAVDEEAQTLTVNFPDSAPSVYQRSELGELTHAYATTVHKLQGSEVRNMIFPITMAHKPMLYRNLLYTGVSRAKDLCVLVGEEEALRHAIDNDDPGRRLSNFSRRLQADIAVSPDHSYNKTASERSEAV